MERFSVRIRQQVLSWPVIATCAVGAACLATLPLGFVGAALGALVVGVVGLAASKTRKGQGPLATTRWVRAELRVGADGIALGAGRGASFIPHHDIVDAYSPTARRVLIQRGDGTREEIRTRDEDALLAAIDRAQSRRGAPTASPPAELACPPGEEAALAARAPHLLHGDAYRTQRLAPDEAERIATDPDADPLARAAAMRALAEAPPAMRVKLRVAVEETAHPVLRKVLADALDGELAGEALRALRAR